MSGGATGSRTGWKATYRGRSILWSVADHYGSDSAREFARASYAAKANFGIKGAYANEILPEGMTLEQIPATGKEMKAYRAAQNAEWTAKQAAQKAEVDRVQGIAMASVMEVLEKAGVSVRRGLGSVEFNRNGIVVTLRISGQG